MSAGPEDILQMQVARLLPIVAPDLLWWHTPNGGYRHPREARKLKDMGVRPGVADLVLILPGNIAAFIELKVGRNPQTDAQKSFQSQCEARGLAYAICKTVDDVLNTLRSWGVPLRARSPE
ncbi:MAG: VRR-NUC domain-containing protein [Brevundimonas sp.]|uniref:VRR-NUC domain-containing protein n=1 Tax=Brevundimonas sp. TaxID=1871086 RepID=UPI0040334FB9